jgi:5'(3')-deoxyribonucleotidase
MSAYPDLKTAKDIDKFLGRQSSWPRVHEEYPHFFRDLPACLDADELMRGLLKLERHGHIQLRILTASPKILIHTSVPDDKRTWIHRHYPDIPASHIHVVARKQKRDFARTHTGTPSILIDDFVTNIREWADAGGIPIHHTSATTSLAALTRHIQVSP